ncbi:MAG: sensor histidine kinase, partial [Thermoanaerobaculia bacterium]
VDDLRPRSRRRWEFDFGQRVAELRERFAREWNVQVEVDVGPMHPLVTQALGHETFRMIAEAVTNAAKHGQASRVIVYLATREDRLWIRVQDDGIGFPFRGRYNLSALLERHQGPLVLCERVMALNGDLTVDSTEEGATLEISLPLGWRAES